MYLNLLKSDVSLGLSSGKLTIKNTSEGKITQEFPFGEVEGISVFGQPSLSTPLLRGCMKNAITVSFYTENGHYFGRLAPSEHVDPIKQKMQLCASDDPEFSLVLSKKIVQAKIYNSICLLKSKNEIYDFNDSDLFALHHSLDNINGAHSISQVMGFEGNAAKAYFSCLSKLLYNDEFRFRGRSSHPPKDPFNSMLSYGYSLLYRNIIGSIESSGLHPYFAFLHKIRPGHAALASDLIEEWRAFLVDRVVLDFVNNEEVFITDFKDSKNGSFYMEPELMKKLTREFGDVFVQTETYFMTEGDKRRYGFQVALQKKLNSLFSAIEGNDPNLYRPFIWSRDYSHE